MKKFSKKLKKAFTLVELVVVIAIIAILSAASVATYFGVTTSARKTTGKAEAQQVMDVIRVAALDESDDSIKAVQVQIVNIHLNLKMLQLKVKVNYLN